MAVLPDINKGVVMLKLTRRPGETLILQTDYEEIRIYFDLDGKQIKVLPESQRRSNLPVRH